MGEPDFNNNKKANVTVILGAQWGDEGKGKIVDLIAHEFNYVARCAGGNNAGHTIVLPSGKKLDFHMLPSGLAHKGVINIIGNGCVVNIPSMLQELEQCDKWGLHDAKSRLKISDRAQLVCDLHQQIDKIQEDRKGKAKIGTTLKGIGPCYSGKAGRSGIRLCDLMAEDPNHFSEKFKECVVLHQSNYPELKVNIEEEISYYQNIKKVIGPMVADTVKLLNTAVYDQNTALLVEGANAAMLDVDFGTYPFVTSSSTTIGGVCTGLGLPPTTINTVYGVTKAYCTRVGTGPFPTELGENNGQGSAVKFPELDISSPTTDQQYGTWMQVKGNEYGTTTKRARRCGWLDLVQLRYAHMINHFNGLAMTKLDVLDGLSKIAFATSYRRKDTGEIITDFPADSVLLLKCEPVLEWFDGWSENTTECRQFCELPENAQKYVIAVESALKIRIKWVGIGPDRHSIIVRS